MQWNSCSIAEKRDDLILMINEYKPNVIAINESWLNPGQPFSIPGFKIARKDRATRGGGVLLAFAQELNVSVEDINSPFEVVSGRIQMAHNFSISIASVYFPSPPFNVSYQALMQTIRQMGSPKMILGDFNSHGTDWGGLYNDQRSQILSAVFDEFNLTILNTGQITRIAAPPALCSAIDLSLCSASVALSCSWRVLDCPNGSDHIPIIINFRKRPEIRPRTGANTRCLSKHINWDTYRAALVDRLSVSESWSYDNLLAVITSCAVEAQTVPLNLLPRSIQHGLPKHWWNADLQTKYNAKKEAFRNFRRNGARAEFLAYKHAEAVFKRARRLSKRECWRSFCSSLNASTSLSTLYTMARRFRGVNSDTRSIVSPDEWLPAFCDKLAPTYAPLPKCEFPDVESIPRSEVNGAFLMIELETALSSSNNSSAGMDQISFALLRELPEEVKVILLKLFNMFFDTGEFPESWFVCKVVAILKPRKYPNMHDSYRPVCLLSCMRKTFEKMLHARIDFWAETQHRIASSQYGFRKGYGTQDCLAVLTTDLHNTFANKGLSLCVFMDISAAYDDVLINVLHSVLLELEMDPQMAAVVCRLFYMRVMYFHWQNECKETRVGYKGLAQGSSLSPMLYNLYTAAVEKKVPRNIKVLQYADDVAGRNRADGAMMEREMQTVLTRIVREYSKLGLSISTN